MIKPSIVHLRPGETQSFKIIVLPTRLMAASNPKVVEWSVSDVFVNSYYGPTHKFTPEGHIVATFAEGDPPDGSVYFHNVTGDKWGNVYVMARPMGGAQRARLEEAGEDVVSVTSVHS
jgi:hypothetical protein